MVTSISKAMVAPDLPDTDIQKKVCMKFYNEYTKRHKDYSHYAGNTWDQVNLIAKALEKVDSKLDPKRDEDLKLIREQLRDNVEKIQGFVGQNGVFNFSPMNHVGLEVGCYVTVVVRSAKWRLYKQ